MHVVSKPQLSLGEKVGLLFKLLVLSPARLAFNTAQLLTFAAFRGLSLSQYFTCAKVKLFFTFSGRQLQFLLPNGSDAYEAWIKSKRKASGGNEAALQRLESLVQRVPDRPANLLWIGDRKAAKKVVLFLHGGGYVIPAFDGYFQACWNTFIRPQLEDGPGGRPEGDEVAVAVLQYDLAEAAPYPSQLKDAAGALAVLLGEGILARDIVVGGDSAGGNLTMLLLHHLLRPHPEVAPLKVEEPLAGAFLVSPWLSLDYTTASFRRNARCDMLSLGILESLKRGWMTEERRGAIESSKRDGSEDAWAVNPAGVEESWLRDLAEVTPKLYVTAGEEEMLLDNAIEVVEKLKNVGSAIEVKLDVVKGEAHDWLAVEGIMNDVGSATKRLGEWVRSVYRG